MKSMLFCGLDTVHLHPNIPLINSGYLLGA